MEEFYLRLNFNRLLEVYPNKRNNYAAYKAFKVTVNSEEVKKQEQIVKRIHHAAKVYAFDTVGGDPDFLFLLSNFLHEDHWQDVLGSHSDFDSYLAYIDELNKEASLVIKEWNKACKPHWCKVHSEKRIDIVIAALKNEEFRKHWKDALKKAKLIFYKQLRENDKNAWLTLSLPWFCKTKTDSFTVLKIIDGEYGKAYDPRVNYPKYVERTQTDIENSKKLFNEVFKDFNLNADPNTIPSTMDKETDIEDEFD